jgi:hypothetical protein
VHLWLKKLRLNGMIGSSTIFDNPNITCDDGSTSHTHSLAKLLLIFVLFEYCVRHVLRHEEGIALRLHSEANIYQLPQWYKALLKPLHDLEVRARALTT